ncbi:MAG: 50S ribosomal protein L5 [Candidatus Buchananbacteria bacterium RIFCSPHIGHO2_02_FULL_38_8]|uniref:Large ribosomal subunit protein uL5 n=2 Tax=Candidatus Buchananiibacteriota TaxID=1817903 RepID=A0A1G1XZV6_9BACT|nr:MAG: 50S ribosomal protein L5 [Candidatus Buchananbacteria bacterium RIFCSPHIGHO2_01_FULL_39_8]OGY47537.1 MAG: 50S ribosomal protein L5 [Candidatus Buchananbacteria bacterium RIFCSPHIGHO2_02_FULL_38_8]
MNRLKEKYQKGVIPAMEKAFGYKNDLAVPKLEKVIVNVGTGPGLKDSKFNEVVANTLQRITGQRPVSTTAKKSISNFKIRKGLIVGMIATLRGKRMYDFVDKLINVTLPRVRDFRGLSVKMVDGQGNLNIGFKEHIAFPEIKADEVEKIHGLQVSVITSAKTKEEGLELLKLLGFPFYKE